MRDIDARTLTPYKRRAVLEKFDYCCVYCFGKADEVDHVTPWSLIHDDSEENLVASCWLCNRIAGDKVFRSFPIKRTYVVNKRYRFTKERIIPVWTKKELLALGYNLRTKVESGAIICATEEERDSVARILNADGWTVVIKNGTKITGRDVLKTMQCAKGRS